MKELKELAALTRRHINENYDAKEWLPTDKESYDYFKDLARAETKKAPQPEIAEPPPPKKITSCAAPKYKKEPPPAPEPKNEEEKKAFSPKTVDQSIQLQPSQREEAADLSPQIALIRQVCPQIQIVEDIPEPRSEAVKFFFAMPGESENSFRSKVIKALEERGVVADAIDCESEEDLVKQLQKDADARLLLVPRKHLKALQDLGHSQHSSTMKHYLQKTPLIALEEVALYETDLSLKRMLWQQLRSELNI